MGKSNPGLVDARCALRSRRHLRGYSAGTAEGETKEAPPIRRGLEYLAGFEPAISPFGKRGSIR